MSEPLFKRVALIGLGLIGSSLARVMKREKLAGHILLSKGERSELAEIAANLL